MRLEGYFRLKKLNKSGNIPGSDYNKYSPGKNITGPNHIKYVTFYVEGYIKLCSYSNARTIAGRLCHFMQRDG